MSDKEYKTSWSGLILVPILFIFFWNVSYDILERPNEFLEYVICFFMTLFFIFVSVIVFAGAMTFINHDGRKKD